MNARRESKGARGMLRAHFLANIDRVMDSDELRLVAGNISEWARRIRELRTEEGFQILTHNDRSDLKPGEYLLLNPKPQPAFERATARKPALSSSTETGSPASNAVRLPEKRIHTI